MVISPAGGDDRHGGILTEFQCPRGLCGDFSLIETTADNRANVRGFNAREGFVVISPSAVYTQAQIINV